MRGMFFVVVTRGRKKRNDARDREEKTHFKKKQRKSKSLKG